MNINPNQFVKRFFTSSYAYFGGALGVNEAVAATVNAPETITAALSSPMVADSVNTSAVIGQIMADWFPSLVADGSLTIVKGAFYLYGLEVGMLLGLIIKVLTIVSLLIKIVFDVVGAIKRKRLEQVKLEEQKLKKAKKPRFKFGRKKKI